MLNNSPAFGGFSVDNIEKARQFYSSTLGLDAKAYLDNNDATAFFAATGDLLLTGPTLTNVNDVRVILVDAYTNGPNY